MHRQARCYVEVSRSQIAANYRAVRDALRGSAKVIGVVKADAYGHGAVEVSRTLCREGIEWLAVSSVDEGCTLRQAGIEARILVMAGVLPWEREAVREFRLTPVVHSLPELLEWNRGTPVGVHLKIDTGMDRMGTLATASEIAAAITASPKVTIEGLMSHFASATDFSSSQTWDQIRWFEKVTGELADLGIRAPLMHFCSTNAIAYPRREAWLSLVRPGHAIYGYVSPARGPAPQPIFSVKPALCWKTHIVNVKDVPPGARIGYGGGFMAPTRMRIAVLAAGYADGIPHRLGNKGKVIAGGVLCGILGPVSMDLTTIDVTHAPLLQPGDEVTLLGREGNVSLDAQQIGRIAGTISYNVLCSISARVKRFYTE